MHQHITAEHRPLGHHRLMPRRVPRGRQQPHPAQSDLTVHHSELPGLDDWPDHPLVRRPAPHVLEFIPLYDVLRVPEPWQLTLRSTPRDPGGHASAPRCRCRSREPPPSPAAPATAHSHRATELPHRRPDPGISQYDARITNHQVAVVQPPPRQPGHSPAPAPRSVRVLGTHPGRASSTLSGNTATASHNTVTSTHPVWVKGGASRWPARPSGSRFRSRESARSGDGRTAGSACGRRSRGRRTS